MSKKLLIITSFPIMVIHLFILYFWIFNFEILVTEIGLIIWIGSILLGLSIYFLSRKLNIKEKSIIVSKMLILASTLMTVLLGLFALIIMFIVSSMP
ncbi:hypothetical protein P5770_19790 [Bacillus cereus]|uniref:hypothetical protein n=1 Tax=Bacillus cereus TaxID=1396 RepID=UPI00240530E1|nr:hypothetical protein [Bacillus cereus]MDF9478956.1 hypothetical protein [Bacillus cereus]MDF9500535.1 hypothetical protein [Bacillus cereus]MDF9518333.1 hypothetical protein [Bacillus cereus]MDF9569676.1 hypothetical protein [Bacillus cereus]